MDQVLQRVVEICKSNEAMVGMLTRKEYKRFAPCRDVFFVCLEGSGNISKIHCYPCADMGTEILIGGRVGRSNDRRQKGKFYLKHQASGNSGIKLLPAGVSKIAAIGDSPEYFREGTVPDRNILDSVSVLLAHYDSAPRMTKLCPPQAYINTVDKELLTGRRIDEQLLRASRFRLVKGVPVAPRDGVVTELTDTDITINQDTVISQLASGLENRVAHVFDPRSFTLYPLVKVGQQVKEGQALFTPFPPTLKTVEDVGKLPNVDALRWMVMQDLVEDSDGMPLTPMFCLDEKSSTGPKFIDLQSIKFMRIPVAYDGPNGDPLYVSEGGVTVNFKFTWHRNGLMAAARTATAAKTV